MNMVTNPPTTDRTAGHGSRQATRLSIALDRYDRTLAYFNARLRLPPGLELQPKEVGMLESRADGDRRHGRMLHDREFDIAEVSLASYVIARSRGARFTAAPVFQRRLFSQAQIYVAQNSGLVRGEDLAGRRVILHAFQVTVSVQAKGDLQREYGVPWTEVEWMTMADEEIDREGLPITRLPVDCDPFEMLRQGQADAVILPHPPAGALAPGQGIRRLYLDTESECFAYYRRNGYFPIMHILALRDDVAERLPELAPMLMDIDRQAMDYAYHLYHDTGYSVTALQCLAQERQKASLGLDIWPDGIAANRLNLERFIADLVDQKLIDRPLAVEELFHPSTHAS